MKDFSTRDLSVIPQDSLSDIEKTVSSLIDPDDGSELPSPDVLRRKFDIADGDDFRDYGDLKLLGLGGMGAVFQADDPALERKVALKILRSNFRNRYASVEKFIREARITAKIDHPNIVSVHRLGVLEHIGVYFTMKKVDGETLREILKKVSEGKKEYVEKFHLRRLLEIFIAGCNGIAAAHSHGYIHCDLKPGNLMVGRFGEVLVLDWGVAREKIPPGPPSREELKMYASQEPVEGTPIYMAPELLSGEITYPDEQTDVYGLGAILYSIVTRGALPFDIALPYEELQQKIIHGEITSFSQNMRGTSRRRHELRAICRKAMARSRLMRYNSVEELVDDLQNYLDGFPVSACSPTIFGKLFKLIRRRPLIPAVLLAIGLSYLVYLGISTFRLIAEDNALKTIITDNYNRGDFNRKIVMRRRKMLRDDAALSKEERESLQRNMYNSALNAAIEYNLVFDAASRLSSKSRLDFLRKGGCDYFAQILRLYRMLENPEMIRGFLMHCRNKWNTLFAEACDMEPRLKNFVDRLEDELKSI